MNECKYRKKCEHYRTDSAACNNFLTGFKNQLGEPHCGTYHKFQLQEVVGAIYNHFEEKEVKRLKKEEEILESILPILEE